MTIATEVPLFLFFYHFLRGSLIWCRYTFPPFPNNSRFSTTFIRIAPGDRMNIKHHSYGERKCIIDVVHISILPFHQTSERYCTRFHASSRVCFLVRFITRMKGYLAKMIFTIDNGYHSRRIIVVIIMHWYIIFDQARRYRIDIFREANISCENVTGFQWLQKR